MKNISLLAALIISGIMMTGCGTAKQNHAATAGQTTTNPTATADHAGANDATGDAGNNNNNNGVMDNAGNAAGDIIEGAGDVVDDAGEAVDNAADNVGNAVKDATN